MLVTSSTPAYRTTGCARACHPPGCVFPLLSDSSMHVTNEQIISEKDKFVLIAYHYIEEVKK